MNSPETRTLPSGITVNVFRPSINIAPLSNKQVEDYLAGQPKPDDPPEAWTDRAWELLAISATNANRLRAGSGNAVVTVDELKSAISASVMLELQGVIFELSGLTRTSAAGEASAAPSTSGNTSDSSVAA
jgi:hypothetical protein